MNVGSNLLLILRNGLDLESGCQMLDFFPLEITVIFDLFWFHVDCWMLIFGSTLSAFGVPFAPSVATRVPCIPQDLHCCVKIVFSELSLTRNTIKIWLHNCNDIRNIFLNLISLLRACGLEVMQHTHTQIVQLSLSVLNYI